MSVSEIYEGIKESIVDDGTGNFIELQVWMSEANTIVSIIVGTILAFTVFFSSFIIGLEILYINFPTLQSSMDIMAEHNMQLEKILGLALRDARKALYKSNTLETGRSVNLEYFSIKWRVIFITFFLIGLLAEYQLITNFILNIVYQILNSI